MAVARDLVCSVGSMARSAWISLFSLVPFFGSFLWRVSVVARNTGRFCSASFLQPPLSTPRLHSLHLVNLHGTLKILDAGLVAVRLLENLVPVLARSEPGF